MHSSYNARNERPDASPADACAAPAAAPSARDWILVDCGRFGVRPRRLRAETSGAASDPSARA